jgi:hypothetical protein
MKIIALGLWITFFILGFMVIGGAFNFFNSAKSSVSVSNNFDCVGISYTIDYISYESDVLTFSLKHQNEISSSPIPGIKVRASENDTAVSSEFEKELSKGMSKKVSFNITLTEDYFFVSPIGCSSEYEKRCYISKESCN